MHETPFQDISPTGPFDRWPTGREGFEKFYGFMHGEMHQWYPTLFEGTSPVEQPATPEEGYHFSKDIVDRALDWIRDVKSIGGGRPFFCYLSFGATHAPFHVHRAWVEKYRGRFEHGWDRQRELTLARQMSLGVVPNDTQLAPWAPSVPHWQDLTDSERRAACALMELYAGFAEHTDAQVGRFVDALSALGCLDDTLLFYILGDNGASGEGGRIGTVNEYLSWNGLDVSADDILAEADRLGGPETWPHYPAGWALAMDTPYQWMKQVASHYGGTRNGLIVHWPEGIGEPGSLRHQWHHVVDIAPTILEAAGLPAPVTVDGVAQQPIAGTAMNYSFNVGDAPDRHTTQYFEIHGSRGIYHDGWVACTPHRTAPWDFYDTSVPEFRDDRWELYDTRTDWSQSRDVAAEHPRRLEHLKELFMIEATHNQVLPLDDRPMAERVDSERGQIKSLTFHGRCRRVPAEAMPRVIGTSFAVTARIVVPEAGARGVICAQGGRFSGWSLYCRDDLLTYCHNIAAKDRFYVRAAEKLTPGCHEIGFTFRYDGGGLKQGGTGTLSIDGRDVGRERIPRTVGFVFQMGEEFNVGIDPQTPVTDEYFPVANAFTGTIDWLRIDDLEQNGETAHVVDSADRLRIALATE
jgi:arylsulfatase